MSATNRGGTRKPHDFYPTPISTIETFLDVFPLRGGIEVLEPGAGSGNIIKTLQKYGDFSIDAVEIRPEEAQHLQDLGVNVIIDDFLSMDLGKSTILSSATRHLIRRSNLLRNVSGYLNRAAGSFSCSAPRSWKATSVLSSGSRKITGSPDSTPYISARALPDTERTPRVTRGSYGSPAVVTRQ